VVVLQWAPGGRVPVGPTHRPPSRRRPPAKPAGHEECLLEGSARVAVGGIACGAPLRPTVAALGEAA
jgi:hypothetical protein